jgi:PiT family inorganic phosphate transporter
MGEVLLAAALLVAFANGANDNTKGVATLYGSGVLSYRRALVLATLSTAVGSLASLPLAAGLVAAFSGKGLIPAELLGTSLLAAVALAAAATVLLATRLGFPISTTHALVGGIAGAGWVAAGSDLNLGALGGAFLLPLAAGPLLAIGLAVAGLRAGQGASRSLGISSTSCVCIGQQWVPVGSPAALVTSTGGSEGERVADQRLELAVGDIEGCQNRYDGRVAGVSAQGAVTSAHLLSAGLVGFARGLNDTPKILALVVGASILSPVIGTLAIAATMALGGWVAARRVTETLGKRIAPMTPGRGLAANLATSLLVIAASRLGLPVSTTHVSAGGIFGIGAAEGALRGRATGEILTAWFTTLPLAALLGAAAMWGLG